MYDHIQINDDGKFDVLWFAGCADGFSPAPVHLLSRTLQEVPFQSQS